jgi:hypothetical protein
MMVVDAHAIATILCFVIGFMKIIYRVFSLRTFLKTVRVVVRWTLRAILSLLTLYISF